MYAGANLRLGDLNQHTLQAIRGRPPNQQLGAALGPGFGMCCSETRISHPRAVGANANPAVALPILVGSGWKALHAQTLLAVERRISRAGLLPDIPFRGRRARLLLSQSPYGFPSQTVIQIGRPGPNQTATLLWSRNAAIPRIREDCNGPSADKRLTAEAKWLQRAGSAPELDNQVPRWLSEGVAPNGRRTWSPLYAPTARTPGHLPRRCGVPWRTWDARARS